VILRGLCASRFFLTVVAQETGASEVSRVGKRRSVIRQHTLGFRASRDASPQVGRRQRNRPAGSAASVGMSLVELVLLVAILGLLFAVGIPLYANYRDKARNAKAAADIVMIQFDVRFFASVNNNQLPTSLDQFGRGTIRDPWGNAYRYLNFATVHGTGQMRKDRFLVPINTDYDLYSMGKDGRSALPLTSRYSRDDLIRANDGAFIGLASDY
jgi:general secretion pathway protein G